jgi:hypothetical protein
MVSGLFKSAVFAAGVALAVPAIAHDAAMHVVNLVLPDGQIEQVSYHGDVPPRFVAVPVGFAASPFADFERMSAMMDRQMDAMMQQAAALSRLTPAMLTGMQVGAPGTTFVATFSSDGTCTRSTQITYAPGMARPQQVSNVSGDCVAGQRQRAPEVISTPTVKSRHTAPLTTLARADGTPAQAILRDAVWRQ